MEIFCLYICVGGLLCVGVGFDIRGCDGLCRVVEKGVCV